MAITTFVFTIYKQNTVYSGIKATNPVFLKIEEGTNENYIMSNPSSPFALVPTASNNLNADNFPVPNFPANLPPISSFNSPPDMPDMPLNLPLSPDMAFAQSLSIKAIIYSENKNNIAILSNGQNEIAVGVGQETPWGRVNAINMDSVIIGQEKILARQSI